jgi:hypothetical protein
MANRRRNNVVHGAAIIAAVLFVGLVCDTVSSLLTLERDRERVQDAYKVEWARRFKTCRTLAEVKALPQPSIGSLNIVDFPDGSWLAVAWHDTHDAEGEHAGLEGEWNGIVMRDSKGRTFWSTYHICGFEGFSGEFLNPKAKTLDTAERNAEFPRVRVS